MTVKQIKKNIVYSDIRNIMGTGFTFRLVISGKTLLRHTYLDIFELPEEIDNPTDDDARYYYDEWLENHLKTSHAAFVALCESKFS